MIRAKFTHDDGRAIAFLGITAENVRRLKDDQPIEVEMVDDFKGVDKIIIAYEETHEDFITRFNRQGVTLPDGALEAARGIDDSL